MYFLPWEYLSLSPFWYFMIKNRRQTSLIAFHLWLFSSEFFYLCGWLEQCSLALLSSVLPRWSSLPAMKAWGYLRSQQLELLAAYCKATSLLTNTCSPWSVFLLVLVSIYGMHEITEGLSYENSLISRVYLLVLPEFFPSSCWTPNDTSFYRASWFLVWLVLEEGPGP